MTNLQFGLCRILPDLSEHRSQLLAVYDPIAIGVKQAKCVLKHKDKVVVVKRALKIFRMRLKIPEILLFVPPSDIRWPS